MKDPFIIPALASEYEVRVNKDNDSLYLTVRHNDEEIDNIDVATLSKHQAYVLHSVIGHLFDFSEFEDLNDENHDPNVRYK